MAAPGTLTHVLEVAAKVQAAAAAHAATLVATASAVSGDPPAPYPAASAG